MNVLENIIAHKSVEVKECKERVSISELEKSEYFQHACISLKDSLLHDNKVGVIAEFKRKSPSKGLINGNVSVENVSKGYTSAGASAISVLTDQHYFGGSIDDLKIVRRENQIPILRKDFTIDEYQLIEAKSIGADIILLIAAALNPTHLKNLAKFAKSLGLEVLMEVRDKEEILPYVNEYIDFVGVNNRSLKDFTTNVSQSFEMAELIPNDFLKISESALDSAKVIHDLKAVGYKGFLIGETFMQEENPGKACAEFIQSVLNFPKV